MSDVIAFAETAMAVRSGTDAVRAAGQVVTANYFTRLGVGAAEGRTLSATDDRSDGETPAVVSHALGQRLFGSARAAVDKSIEINGHPFRIIGYPAPCTAFTLPTFAPSPRPLWCLAAPPFSHHTCRHAARCKWIR